MATQLALTTMAEQETLDFYHQKFARYGCLQMSKDTLWMAAGQAGNSNEDAAKVITAKQNARDAGYCLDKAKNLDAMNARLARARATLEKRKAAK
jgi:hypothetical protein